MESLGVPRLRLVEFNVENLFIHLDHYDGQDLQAIGEKEWQRLSTSITKNKPIENVRRLAAAITDMDPDILMLCEVGGRESLENFNRYFLGGLYTGHIIEGNSDRGIDVAYLTKKILPYTYDLVSHRHRSIDFLYEHERLSKESGYGHLRSARKTTHKFSRDVLELRVFNGGEQPVLAILLTHLKSQLDRERIDPGGRDRRKAELEKMIDIYGELEWEFGGKTPILLAGDLNGQASRVNTDFEFESVYRRTALEDCLQVAGISAEERFTFQQFNNRRPTLQKQFDYIFIPPSLAPYVHREETWVYRFKDEIGMTMVLPRNLNEKRTLPSDHYPVILTLMA